MGKLKILLALLVLISHAAWAQTSGLNFTVGKITFVTSASNTPIIPFTWYNTVQGTLASYTKIPGNGIMMEDFWCTTVSPGVSTNHYMYLILTYPDGTQQITQITTGDGQGGWGTDQLSPKNILTEGDGAASPVLPFGTLLPQDGYGGNRFMVLPGGTTLSAYMSGLGATSFTCQISGFQQ